jgi:hypothetical protein
LIFNLVLNNAQLDILPNAKNIHVILRLRCRVFKHDVPGLGLR